MKAGQINPKPANLKIIGFVRRRPFLWNAHDPYYHSNATKMKQWDILASELKLTIEDTKLKWRGLRDTFRKELVRMKAKRGKVSQWQYFPFLLFLTDFIEADLTRNIERDDYYKRVYGLDTFDIDPDDIKLSAFEIEELSSYKRKPLAVENESRSNSSYNIKEEPEMYIDEEEDDDDVEHNGSMRFEDFDSSQFLSLSPPPEIERVRPPINHLQTSNQRHHNVTNSSSSSSSSPDQDSDYLFLISFVRSLQSFRLNKQLKIRMKLLHILNSEKLEYEKMGSSSRESLPPSNRFSDNSERSFLLSLLPFLKIVPMERKLIVRSKITELFYKHVGPLMDQGDGYMDEEFSN